MHTQPTRHEAARRRAALWAEVERRDAEVLKLRTLLTQLEDDVANARRWVAEAERQAAALRSKLTEAGGLT